MDEDDSHTERRFQPCPTFKVFGDPIPGPHRPGVPGRGQSTSALLALVHFRLLGGVLTSMGVLTWRLTQRSVHRILELRIATCLTHTTIPTGEFRILSAKLMEWQGLRSRTANGLGYLERLYQRIEDCDAPAMISLVLA